jgi:SAM-dependent methyltransferase
MVLRQYVHPRLIGKPDGNWLIDLAHELPTRPNGRWLSIGCGNGAAEISAAELGLCGQMEGIDCSRQAVEVATREVTARGLANARFRVSDIERDLLPIGRYDVIVASMSLHHVRRLEFVLDEVARALAPGGWLLVNEYVGPDRWQWTDAQLGAIAESLAGLPERYRVHALTGEVKRTVTRPTIEQMIQTDPSEAVRSTAIIPLLTQRFELDAEIRGRGAPRLRRRVAAHVAGVHRPQLR